MRTDIDLPRVLVPAFADDLGITPARLRTELSRGNWRTIARGAVLTRPEEPTRADWAAFGIAVAGPSAALSGWDAVRLLGLGTSWAPTDQVLVLTRHASNRVIGRVRIRETCRAYRSHLTAVDQGEHSLTPVVHAARAVTDAALDYHRLVPVQAMVTAAVQRRHCTAADLLTELDTAPRNGSALLRQALGDVVDGARSPSEATAARRMTAGRIPAFELNVPMLDAAGHVLFVADVLWRSLRAVLEIDSKAHHFDEADWFATMARHNQLTRAGLAVQHRPPAEVCGPGHAWLDDLRAWLAARAREVGVPLPRRTGVIRPPGGAPVPFHLP